MERIIQPYLAPGQITRAEASSHSSQTVVMHPVKGPADYVRALRRRIPLIVMATILVGIPGAAYVIKMPAVYKATGQIRIEPPRFDTFMNVILSNNNIPANDHESQERYVPNRLAIIQGRALAEKVVNSGDIGTGKGFESDPPAELMGNVTNRRLMPGTNIFEIALEGRDAERVNKLMNALLDKFQQEIKDESFSGLKNAEEVSQANVSLIHGDLAALEKQIGEHTKKTAFLAPAGTHTGIDDYSSLKNLLVNKKIRFDDIKHEARVATLYPGLKGPATPSKYAAKLEYLMNRRDYYTEQLEAAARVTRNIDTDPASKRVAMLLNQTLDDIEEISKLDTPTEYPDLASLAMNHHAEEIRKLEREVKAQLDQVQATMPEYQKYLSMQREREQLEQRLATTEERLNQFKMVSKTRTDPVMILQKSQEPGGPVRPNRPILIGVFCLLGFMMGAGLVCFFEYIDHSVKVPEHLSAGLALPILSVIPRMKRLAHLQRGGHLWTAADPLSLEADAYRNLRASLIGATGPRGPIVTLLVTSAKAGEGKSTTALNLALTCARAGERTLLMDVDLRRPSLAEVFNVTEPNVGLVDVLRGDMPWQQAVVRTDVPNLNFLPTGDPSGVPIEVLGTLELRQLISAVSKGYQRVILDAPAVLGLADCRMLGRTVDAAILVVRSGAHEIRPLRRAKEMLEQSQVPLAGVVFNGLSDDLDNWASYGTSVAPLISAPRSRVVLNAPADEFVTFSSD